MGKEIAFISGATSGIGAAFANHFARKGYDLILTGHPDDKITLYVEELKERYGVYIEIILADFAKEEDIRKIEEIIESNHRIEVLINNAGFVFGIPFLQNDIRSWGNMVKVHINAPVRFIYAALPNMISKGKGVIVNLSSLASFMPIPQDMMYSATKLFNNSFMESLHISLREKGIKVQVLCPGFVNSNFHKRAGIKLPEFNKRRILRWMDPEKIVEISIRNLRKKNKVIVIPGFRNNVIRFMFMITPKKLYYRLAAKHLT